MEMDTVCPGGGGAGGAEVDPGRDPGEGDVVGGDPDDVFAPPDHPGDVVAPPDHPGGSATLLFPGTGLPEDLEEANALELEFSWMQDPDPKSPDGRALGDPEPPSPPTPPTPASSGGGTPLGGPAGEPGDDLRDSDSGSSSDSDVASLHLSEVEDDDDDGENEEEQLQPDLGAGFVRPAKGTKCYHVAVCELLAGRTTPTGKPGSYCANIQKRFQLCCGSDLRQGFWVERLLDLEDGESLCKRCQSQL